MSSVCPVYPNQVYVKTVCQVYAQCTLSTRKSRPSVTAGPGSCSECSSGASTSLTAGAARLKTSRKNKLTSVERGRPRDHGAHATAQHLANTSTSHSKRSWLPLASNAARLAASAVSNRYCCTPPVRVTPYWIWSWMWLSRRGTDGNTVGLRVARSSGKRTGSPW